VWRTLTAQLYRLRNKTNANAFMPPAEAGSSEKKQLIGTTESLP
jgi:hypothetical protein